MRAALVALLIAAVVLVPPLTVEAALLTPELLDVIATGTCPAGPPDVSPYPCTPLEYMARFFFSPFALPAHIILWGGWFAVCGSGAIWFFVIREAVTRLSSAAAGGPRRGRRPSP